MVKRKLKLTEAPTSSKRAMDNCGSDQLEMIIGNRFKPPFTRFFVIKGVSSDVNKLSPFAIQRDISETLGAVGKVKKIRDGLLIEATTAKQSFSLTHRRKFCGLDIKVDPHPSLNFSRGVVTCSDLLNCTVEEICAELRNQGVVDVRRITTVRNGIKTDTSSCILQFNSSELPDSVRAGYHLLKVRPYIPNPLRCFRCQKFGHSSLHCQNEHICACGLAPHPGTPCLLPIQCVNCGLEHSARSKSCPVYLEEAAIQKLKVIERLSYSEAKRKLKTTTPSFRRSFADVTTSSSNNISSDQSNKLVEILVPEILRLLESNLSSRGANHSPPQSSMTTLSTTRSFSRPIKDIPTSVLRSRSVSTKSSTVQSSNSKNGNPDKRIERQAYHTNINTSKEQMHQDDTSDHLETRRSSSRQSVSASANDEQSSIRERSSSCSSTERPKKKTPQETEVSHNTPPGLQITQTASPGPQITHNILSDTEENIFETTEMKLPQKKVGNDSASVVASRLKRKELKSVKKV